ncbi:MAG: 16S rRNA A1518 and A1519 N6-dimethyltransferase RsmA/KsgA/DIM1 [Candidatus Methanohalarchaeum thermophilum]|uniref:Probable ribosomal RNA small subunit methyltransferase A n=1 Tax=Methanohalarchaeum thermophilum TaxID=1903181 RepID=A0A1Q6DXY9_METT1|nr:MAG: 16S rRNA A1518 and A1519 N6-dimethyltransferase RsmA/KsgA/DIM1 [Candidatus Methanohalarchaeum thermophilum]
MNKKQLKEIEKKLGLDLKKNSDQVFLIDERVAKRQVEYAEISGEDLVLEVGAGTGTLTNHITKRTREKNLTVIEKDPRLVDLLKDRFGEHIKVKLANALEVEFNDFNKIISNLPYSISSEITFKFLDYEFDLAILMYQKEFAERMVAEPEDEMYGRLSVMIELLSDAEIKEIVPQTAFYPRPRVKSAIVQLTPNKTKYNVTNLGFFKRFIKAIFTQRRKKIKNSIINTRHIYENEYNGISKNKREIKKSLPKTEFDLDKRPEDFNTAELVRLSNQFYDELYK